MYCYFCGSIDDLLTTNISISPCHHCCSTSFFEGVIDNPLVGTTIVGAVNVVATYVALLLMDRCGRRTLILWSAGGMFLSCIVIIMSLLHYFSNMWALLAVNSYVSFFEIGLGPIPWLIVAEMFDAKYVAVAMSACSQLNWACNFIVGLGFPYMNKYLGPYSFLPFAGVLAATFMFSLTVLPETQGTTPEELATELVRNASSGVLYEVNPDSVRAIDEEWRKAMEQIQNEEDADMQNGTFGKIQSPYLHCFLRTRSFLTSPPCSLASCSRIWIPADSRR